MLDVNQDPDYSICRSYSVAHCINFDLIMWAWAKLRKHVIVKLLIGRLLIDRIVENRMSVSRPCRNHEIIENSRFWRSNFELKINENKQNLLSFTLTDASVISSISAFEGSRGGITIFLVWLTDETFLMLHLFTETEYSCPGVTSFYKF